MFFATSLRNVFAVALTCFAGFSVAAGPTANQSNPGGSVSTAMASAGSGSKFKAPAAVSEKKAVPGDYIVKFRQGTSATRTKRILGTIPASSLRSYRRIKQLHHFHFAPGANIQAELKKLKANPEVEYVEPNYIYHLNAIPNDPMFSQQWGLNNTGQTNGGLVVDKDINAPEAWDVTTGDSNVVIAVIDSGVDYNHEDLAANIYRNTVECTPNGIDDDGNGYIDDCVGIDAVNHDSDPMDDNGHGTHVSGIIGAVGNNGIGISGVAWNVKLLPCKFADSTGQGTTAAAIECLDYIAAMKAKGVNIVATNNSWGGPAYSQALRDAIQTQEDAGIILVAAAGNQVPYGKAITKSTASGVYPCSYNMDNVICVGSTTDMGQRNPTSNYGPFVISAPGTDILSTLPNNQYGLLSGTSMATPHVTGIAALIASANPSLSWYEIRNLIYAGGGNLDQNPIFYNAVNSYTSLTCTNSPIDLYLGSSHEIHSHPYTFYLNIPITFRGYNFNCTTPSGDITVGITETGETLVLQDNGVAPDQVANDGIYATSWTPTAGGTYTLNLPNGKTAQINVDANLEFLYPLKALYSAGGGPGKKELLTITNTDSDPESEIVAGSGSLIYMWDHDGSLKPGWPVYYNDYATYATPANLDETTPYNEIIGSWLRPAGVVTPPDNAPGAIVFHFAEDGSILNPGGHIIGIDDEMSSPAVVADLDNDGSDDYLIEGSTQNKLFAYDRLGNYKPGWPVAAGYQVMPAVGDLDGDHLPEVVTFRRVSQTPPLADQIQLVALHNDGTMVAGFPVVDPNLLVDQFPLIGDVDGDGQPEIVTNTSIISNTGVIKLQYPQLASVALADFDHDGIPEIIGLDQILDSYNATITVNLHVFHGDGSPVPGFPVPLGTHDMAVSSTPVVGDVDGDQENEIVVATSVAGGTSFKLYVVEHDGSIKTGYPKYVTNYGGGATAIADIDRDGHNEILLLAGGSAPTPEGVDRVWAWDLGGPTHGKIEWGQFRGDEYRAGYYRTGKNLAGQSYLSVHVSGNGTVTSPSGINCGIDCSELLSNGSAVTLTATPAPGESFLSWAGDCTGTSPTCTVSVGSFTSLQAKFTSALTVSLSGSGNGTVTSDITGINCGTDCSENYPGDTFVTLTAAEDANSLFTGWSGACTGTAPTCTVTMTSAKNVIATFDAAARLTLAWSYGTPGNVVSSPAGINCTISTTATSCSSKYLTGQTVQLTATPIYNYAFNSWGGDCAGQGNPCTLTMDSDRNVSVSFSQQETLTASVSGNGSITSNPVGIDCGSDCSEVYLSGTTVSLTATPATGYVFASWGGICSGQGNPCTFSISANTSVVANFATPATLTTSVTGNGTISSSPAGINCGTDCSEIYAQGQAVTLTASPLSGNSFDSWTGACAGQGAICTITMNTDLATAAVFTANPVLYPLSVSISGGGSVTSNPAGITCGTDCSQDYTDGTSVQLTASANSGFSFSGWTGACAGQGNPCTLTMSQAQNTTANFMLIPVSYTLSVALNGNGSVVSNPAGINCGSACSQSYTNGTIVQLTAAAGTGFAFSSWSGACAGQSNPCTLTLSSSTSTTANFVAVINNFSLSVNTTGNGTVTSNPSGIDCGTACFQQYPDGTNVVLTATPGPGYQFVSWSNACAGQSNSCSLTLNSDLTVLATFEKVQAANSGASSGGHSGGGIGLPSLVALFSILFWRRRYDK